MAPQEQAEHGHTPRVIRLASPSVALSDNLMTADEAREFFNLPSRAALYVFAKRNQVPVVKLGARAIRFPRAACERWLAARTSGQVAP